MARGSGQVPKLQMGVLPKQHRSTTDPHQPMSFAQYNPANLRPTTFEKTTDAYMYDVLFQHFQQDKGFWHQWSVVDCAASVPDKGQKQACMQCGTAFGARDQMCQHCGHKRDEGKAPIRVVMDLPGMSELPRSYPPPGVGGAKPRKVQGLPSGYSVPLEAFALEDGQTLLERQRQFNDGQLDPRYHWLQAIISSHWEKRKQQAEAEGGTGAIMPQAKQKATSVRGFMSWLSGAVGIAEQGEASPALTSYGRTELAYEDRNSTGQIGIAREGLVSPYNTKKVVAGPFRPSSSEENLQEVDVPRAAEGSELDEQLKELLARTMSPSDERAAT